MLRGPASFSVNDECGLLVDGFDTPPTLMMPHNPRYYVTLLERAGFAKAKDLWVYEGGSEERYVPVPERRDRLWANTRRLQEGFRGLGFEIGPTETPIVPVLIGPLEKTFLFWRRLFDAGVFTNPVVPPAVPPSLCRLRTSLMATHSDEQIDTALEAFGRLGKELGVI